jgi:hypothetical protein
MVQLVSFPYLGVCLAWLILGASTQASPLFLSSIKHLLRKGGAILFTTDVKTKEKWLIHS